MTLFENRLEIVKGTLSVRKFAELLSVPTTTLQQYLKGRMPPADFIVLVCERFGVDSWWLLTGQGEMKQRQPVMVAEPAVIALPINPVQKEKIKLGSMLARIIDEGDRKKIQLVENQLEYCDPGEKKQGMDCAENEGPGTARNRAA